MDENPDQDRATGIDFSPELARVGTSGDPVVRVAFDRPMTVARSGPDAAEGLLDMTRIVLENVGAGLISGGRASFGAELVAGRHALPFTDGPAFVLEVAEGTVAAGSIEVGHGSRAARDKTLLKAFEIEFSPALRLDNVLETLGEAQRLFEDPRWTAIAELLSRVAKPGRDSDPGFWGRLAQDGPTVLMDFVRRRLAAGGLDLGVILLSGVRGRVLESGSNGLPEMRLAFSGEIRLLNRVGYPFADVELPDAVIPAIHADLDRLISRAPLASGRLQAGRAVTADLAGSMLALLSSARLKLSLDVTPPRLEVDVTAVDRTRLAARLALPASCRLKGELDVRRDRDGWDIEAERVSLLFLQHGGKALTVRLRGHLDSDPVARSNALPGNVRATLSGALIEGSVLPYIEASLQGTHPLSKGAMAIQTRLVDIALGGGVTGSWERGRLNLALAPDGMSFRLALGPTEPSVVRRARFEWSIGGTGTLSGSVMQNAHGGLQARLDGNVLVRAALSGRITPIPELRLDDGTLGGTVAAEVRLDLGAEISRPGEGSGFWVIPSGRLAATLHDSEVTIADKRVTLPQGTRIEGAWREGRIGPKGVKDMALDLSWNLGGGRLLLHGHDRSVSLLSSDLRQGALTVLPGPGGRLMFGGDRRGLYGVRFFNALLSPSEDPQQLLEILESDDALRRVVAALEVFNPDLASLLARFRDWVLQARRGLRAEGIERPGDAVPMNRIARILSMVLVGDASLETRIVPLMRRVTEGQGLDRAVAGAILREVFDGGRVGYEIEAALRWLDLVLSPGEPLSPMPSLPPHEMPLVEQHREALSHVPSGTELCRALRSGHVGSRLLKRLLPFATDLTLAQLDALIETDITDAARDRFRHVARIKRKVARVEEWDARSLPARALFVASFLGEAVGPLPALGDTDPHWPPPCGLGARDAAVLIQTGLAEGHQGLQSQINNRMLLELARSRPGDFLREVLVEMGGFVPRVLSGVLYAFLNQDQDELVSPLDLAALCEDKLGFPVPRRRDFMAGGRRARESYYEALSEVAHRVFDDAAPYLARRAWIHEDRHPLPTIASDRRDVARLERVAQEAILAADERGGEVRFEARASVSRKAARAAYEQAFAACRAFLQACPAGFERGWLKDFWARNEEALKVLSVVRNVQQDVDDVRRWFYVVSGVSHDLPEQRLIEAVVEALYADSDDGRAVAADPLTRMLIDPEEGHYDFTIVSCMGVITDGEKGKELVDAYHRLTERRGVRIIRAHTGLFRPLEHNAAAIIQAIRKVRGPWGILGYSQGCANALMAEQFLLGGTPVQQRSLEGLTCRNFIFSAGNGSAHGTSGAQKFFRAMVDGEILLKHYQAEYSREGIELALRAFRTIMDSRLFINSLGGACSLSLERARMLHRDGQVVPHVPTSTFRGRTTPQEIPEALEYLYFIHRALSPNQDCDSQVASDDAVAHARRVCNPWTRVLEAAEIPSRVQRAHHWTPITAEVEIVTTDRDRERAVYMAPKDRLVGPWVEVNARFGRIARKGG